MGLLLNKESAPDTPASDKGHLYQDSTTELLRFRDDTGTSRQLGEDALASIVAASAAINTTETIIASAAYHANKAKVGSVIRATLEGTCTSTAANASTWRIRLGPLGTTADTAIFTAANSVAAASGTDVPFKAELVLTVRTLGATATVAGYLVLMNTGVTGISAVTLQIVPATVLTFDSTVDNILSVSYVSAATTTTSTFQNAFIESVKV